MVRCLVIIFYSFLSFASQGQDIIHKKSGEQIKCKILKVDDHVVYFYEYETADQIEYRMDAALVEYIDFENKGVLRETVSEEVFETHQGDVVFQPKMYALKTNLDGLWNSYWTLYFEYYGSKTIWDLGFKRAATRINSFSGFQIQLNGVEAGLSYELTSFGNNIYPLRGLYARLHASFLVGDLGFDQAYREFNGGLQLLVKYQISNSFMLEGYFGLSVSQFFDSPRFLENRGDINGDSGILNTSGIRVAYLF